MQRKIEDDLSEGETMCLPMCADRVYTSNAAHLGLIISAGCSIGLICGAVIALMLTPAITNGDSDKQILVTKIAAGVSGSGLLSVIGTGILFFCGTRKKVYAEEESEEAANLLTSVQTQTI